MTDITAYHYCPSCNLKALLCTSVTDSQDRVVSYACRCHTCGYVYETGGQGQGGTGTFAANVNVPVRYPDRPSPESVEVWLHQVEEMGATVSFASAFDRNGKLVFLRGSPPDWVKGSLSDLGYTLKPVSGSRDDNFQPCRIDDPSRVGWGVFEINSSGTIGKRILYSSDLLTATSAL